MVHKGLPRRQRSSLSPCLIQAHSALSQQEAGTRRTLSDAHTKLRMHLSFLTVAIYEFKADRLDKLYQIEYIMYNTMVRYLKNPLFIIQSNAIMHFNTDFGIESVCVIFT